RKDVFAFIELLPDWEELSLGLWLVLLAEGKENVGGWHFPGTVAICAWDRELWESVERGFYKDHAALYERLGVPCERPGERWLVKFSESTAAAYQLVHILLHELGHHHDRMTTRSLSRSSRGERYAERYAYAYEERIWESYLRVFGMP